MSVLRNTIEAFPRGRTTEELFVLLAADFDPLRRQSVLFELDELLKDGVIRRGRDGRWRPLAAARRAERANPTDVQPGAPESESTVLFAAPAAFSSSQAEQIEVAESAEPAENPDPQALLRYWRSALRADPRGAMTQAPDRHGVDWQLIAGSGSIAPEENETRTIAIPLERLPPDFRQALLRREANEMSVALGWPIAVGRWSGAPAVWPVGLFAAEWRRTDTDLTVVVDADDVLINPDWLRAYARATSWREAELRELFGRTDGAGLGSADFVQRLREAAAGQLRDRLTGVQMAARIDAEVEGIYNVAGIFLPTDSTFTLGAVRDIDAIAAWSTDRLAQTALAPVLGLNHDHGAPTFPALNIGPLNAEQIAAVRNACAAPLSVVTGPPGTGKSQAIVSMAASIVAGGGSVLVASKNHQALDAVEDRLGGLASDSAFLVRTLDPQKEVDRSFSSVLAELVADPSATSRSPDRVLQAKLQQIAEDRANLLDSIGRIGEIECDLADLLERISARQRLELEDSNAGIGDRERHGILRRLFGFIKRLVFRHRRSSTRDLAAEASRHGAPVSILSARVSELQQERSELGTVDDPVRLTDEIAALADTVLPAVLAERVSLSEERRRSLLEAKDEFDFSGIGNALPDALAIDIVAHRPVWLASVLGTPRRVPLVDGLFDLVIFDEASQCNIAAALPQLARARRAVVVGDNQQLNFIPQLGQAQDRNLMQAQGLPVARMGRYAESRRSLFDLALRVPDVPRVLLRHQYRSAAPIVEYISEAFYGGKLITSYDPRTLRPPRGQSPGIAWTHVAAPTSLQHENVNRAEVDAIAAHVATLLVEQGYEGTLGVIAPFRPQVHALEEAIRARVPEARLELAEVRVATVDGFQGQERDAILFSPCLGASSLTSAVTFVQRDLRRINVAISRARAVAHVFGDLHYAQSGKVRALSRLASVATEPRSRKGEGVFDSDWERRMYHALEDRGLDPQPQYEIAGRRLDFALFGSGDIKLDLEVDGRHWHQDTDGRRKLSDHWRDHQLASLGWRVRRFWVSELSKDMEACLDLVERDLA